MSLVEAVARAIHDADHCAEPWKRFETLHPDDAEHYRGMAAAAIAAVQSFQVAAALSQAGTNP